MIGTPGRLADHIRRGNIAVDAIQTLVLDEFDKSLELGFHAQMSFITGSLKSLNKKVLTSATSGTEIPAFIDIQEITTVDFQMDKDADTEIGRAS